ncbi:hypothetical protein BDV95DRAFT_502948 [Massariosphaeria phaeospora]|uniref:Short chain dehydrogenase n=1 Tax=Massariosphaeria phaeospora TaxID=100035 RepID=A0A7C8MHR6_9PLEO|nr:hypothetical protein BDV95DRAFT_502948 [Massariosphaeria phaeospora]
MADQTKYTSKLRNARILIIGGSSGIGYAVAEATLESGALVTISSSNPTRVASAVASLKAAYPTSRIHGHAADLSSPATLEATLETLFQTTVAALPSQKLDHVVFTAGDALSTMAISDMSVPKVLQAGQIRFVAPLLTAKFVARFVEMSRRSSYTITTGSISEKPMPDWAVVAAYAGGAHSMVRNLALDLKPVRVNGVSPGVVDTELWNMGKEEKERLLARAAKGMATGVPGLPGDVAESYLAVLKDANMDGAMVRTDGGGMLM